jgi:hypothetical protein
METYENPCSPEVLVEWDKAGKFPTNLAMLWSERTRRPLLADAYEAFHLKRSIEKQKKFSSLSFVFSLIAALFGAFAIFYLNHPPCVWFGLLAGIFAFVSATFYLLYRSELSRQIARDYDETARKRVRDFGNVLISLKIWFDKPITELDQMRVVDLTEMASNVVLASLKEMRQYQQFLAVEITPDFALTKRSDQEIQNSLDGLLLCRENYKEQVKIFKALGLFGRNSETWLMQRLAEES